MAPFGVLNVNKPAGVTSREVVNCVERLVGPAKAGHAGTLDPLATGVLVICVGQATRLIRFVQRMPKRYLATFLLGQTSETDDIERDIVAIPNAVVPTRTAIDGVLPQFIGDIQQRPPAHSAIKIGGKRAYKLARKGADFELATRRVTIHRIDILRYEYPELDLDIECGSGTYIRALGRDLGTALGTAAVMSALQRTAIGEFKIEQAVELSALTCDTILTQLQPARTAVTTLSCVTLTPAHVLELCNGRPILLSWLAHACQANLQNRPTPKDAEIAAFDQDGNLAGLVREKSPVELWPITNFQK